MTMKTMSINDKVAQDSQQIRKEFIKLVIVTFENSEATGEFECSKIKAETLSHSY